MTFADLPRTAAWRHVAARAGFEVAWFEADTNGDTGTAGHGAGWRLRGHTTGLEDGETWSVAYDIELDAAWCTRRARVTQFSAAGEAVTELEADGRGHWRVDGSRAPELDGCLDVDLEASAMTNTLPVHRLSLAPGASADARAAYVRLGPAVERLDQSYRRLDEDGSPYRFDYAAPAFGFTCELLVDSAGLAVDYPGIAVRHY